MSFVAHRMSTLSTVSVPFDRAHQSPVAGTETVSAESFDLPLASLHVRHMPIVLKGADIEMEFPFHWPHLHSEVSAAKGLTSD